MFIFTQDEEVQRIFNLMDGLDQIAFTHERNLGSDDHWVPESPEGKAIFDQLIAPENRQALRKWYARSDGRELNPSALNLKLTLERAIQEKLD